MDTNDKDLQQLLQKMFEKRGFDFRQYKKDMLKRRLARRLSATGTASYSGYANILDAQPEEYKRLFDDLTIKVSWFFRNPLTFELLYRVVLPEMITRKEQAMDTMIRIWSAGCARGEEPYSVAILLTELLDEQLENYHIVIYATDIDRDALIRARVGEYSEDSVLEIEKGVLDKYFHHNGNYKIKEAVKKLVSFSFHDLTSENSIVPSQSVFTNFDLILCRNVLIYFSKDLQKKVLGNFASALDQRGYLVLGEAEALTDDTCAGFVCCNSLGKIYQKTS